MAHNDIKPLNDNDEKAFKNFIATRENPNLKITYYFDQPESTNEEFVIIILWLLYYVIVILIITIKRQLMSKMRNKS